VDFELTNVRDNPYTHQRVRIDKAINAFPEIKIATLDTMYEGYEADIFRRIRDRSFQLIADRKLDCPHHRRFIHNTTFIGDILEVKFPREIELDCGFTQYVNISVVQLHGSMDESLEEAKIDTRQDCLNALDNIYAECGISKNLQSYSLIEQLITGASVLLKDKNPKYKILSNDRYGFTINYRASKANGTEMLTYVLAYRLKRGRRRATD